MNELYNAAIRRGFSVLWSDGRGLGTVTLDRGALRRCRGAGWSIHGIDLRTKLPPNESKTLILKGRGPRGGPYDRGAATRADCS